jgi:hypothetical protein
MEKRAPLLLPFRRHTNILREKIEQAILKMRMVCDAIVNTEVTPKPKKIAALSVDESNALAEGLQKLFNESTADEQIRLLTVAPTNWGRSKVVGFSGCSTYQARTALEMRQTVGVLAYPTTSRGNESLDDGTIEKVLDYYRRDGVSRPSANAKDALLINGSHVVKRFMEMTISQAFESFRTEFPSVKIGRSKFFSLRPKEVKPESPHDVCVCIYHENIALLLKVSESNDMCRTISSLFSRRGI